ncbi:MAG: FAD:protein FMN transferase [Lewinella sp.]|nr:FAD:protein FMN transferase [Lewinella sp.]
MAAACRPNPSSETTSPAEALVLGRLAGKTMGTTYSIVYVAPDTSFLAKATELQIALDSALLALNHEVSNWEPGSTVVRFNESKAGLAVAGQAHFLANVRLAQAIGRASGGAFEPTILPLTDYWGFGAGQKRISAGVDTPYVKSLLRLIGIDKITIEADTFVRKTEPGVMLDLGGSAKGYGVDLLAQLLRSRGLADFLIEIGGEMYAAGTKGGQPWQVGINLPEEGAAFNAVAATMPLTDRAVATSGNYRNYYKVGGETYSHTLNPFSGFPERNTLLSASVLAPDCATADAFATRLHGARP